MRFCFLWFISCGFLLSIDLLVFDLLCSEMFVLKMFIMKWMHFEFGKH